MMKIFYTIIVLLIGFLLAVQGSTNTQPASIAGQIKKILKVDHQRQLIVGRWLSSSQESRFDSK